MRRERIFVGASILLGLAFFAVNLGAQQKLSQQQNAVRARTGGVSNLIAVPVPQTLAPQVANNTGLDDVSVISQPDSAYLGRTDIFPITQPDLSMVSSITESGCTVTFTPAVQARTTTTTWSDWGTPPDTEDPTPRVLYSAANSLTLTFSPGDCQLSTFGLEAEPNPHTAIQITTTFFAGSTQVGTISRTNEFARLFAADAVDQPFTRVVVSSSQDFGISQLHFSQQPGAILAGTVTDTMGRGIAALVRAVGSVTRTTTAASNGVYRMLLPEDTYDVTASAFGYLPSTASGLQLTVGTTTNQDFQLAQNPNAHAISGHVADNTGRALGGVTVTVLNTPLAPATTNANGDYRFSAVPAGSYMIRAVGGGCVTAQTQSATVGGSDIVVNFTLNRPVDAFGYACDDGIAYNWIPGDTLNPLVGDDETAPFPLPFPFTFYGSAYTTLHVCTNGFGNFLGPNTAYTSVCLPKASPPHALLAPLWDDLVITRPAGIYTRLLGTAPNRQYVVEWRNAVFFGQPGNATFEIILNESDNSAVYQYNMSPGAGDGRGAVIGIENSLGTVAKQFSCHQPVIVPNPPNKAIRFFRP